MKQCWLLAGANLRKGKGQALSFWMMILIAALLLSLGLTIWFNYDRAFDRRAETLHSADVVVALQTTDSAYTEKLEADMRADTRTAQLERRSALYLNGTCSYGGSETTRLFAVWEWGQQEQLGQISPTEVLAVPPENPVYLPHLFRAGGGYRLGDSFTLTVLTGQEERSFTYTVAGFFEETLLATINSTTTGLLLDSAGCRTLSEAYGGALDGTLLLARLTDSADSEAYSLTYRPSLPQTQTLSDAVYYQSVKQARTITSTICSMIVVAFSFLITAVALIVVRFRIGNSIEEDTRNLGALKAVGYRSRQIIAAILLQYLSVGAAGVAVGTALSYALLPLLSGLFEAQTGVLWEQDFDPLSAGITALVLLSAVTVVSLVAARKVRLLTPIVALRSGIFTHSFRWNPLPLHRGGGPISVRLAGKAFLQEIKRNLLVGIIVAAVSFTAVFAGVLHFNIVEKPDNFFLACMGELFHVQVDAVSPEAAEQLQTYAESQPEVRKVFSFKTIPAQVDSGIQVFCCLTADFSKYDNPSILYEGRFPKFDNEIALGGLLAGLLKKEPGDTVTLQLEGRTQEYLITGLVQNSNYMGRDALLLEDGFRQLAPAFRSNTLALYLKDGTDAAGFLERFKQEQGSQILAAHDTKKGVEASLGAYRGLVGSLVIVVLAITLAVVALTLYLVVKTLLLRKKRELGIQKAVGFTTAQLVLQTALSLLPVLLLGAAIGSIAGYFLVNPLLSLLFSGIGLMKVGFEILPSLLVLSCLGITLSGLLISVLLSLKIRKITPCALVGE